MALLPNPSSERLRPLPAFIFMSRWLQLPLYLGLILAQGVYVFHFWVELVHLIEAAFGNKEALDMLVRASATSSPPIKDAAGMVIGYEAPKLNETVIMLVVLALIDVVMISNLLIMVIVGGYETFVSRMELEDAPRPARVAEPCQRLGAEGQAGHGHHRHQRRSTCSRPSSTPTTTPRRC